MSALLVTVFLASLLGSVHCAGMCGAFAGLAATGCVQPLPRMAAYHLGRFLVYATLGVGAGFFGSALNYGGEYAGLPEMAAVVTGAAMTGWGLLALLRLGGLVKSGENTASWPQSLTGKLHRKVAGWPPAFRAFGVGMLTSFLPCGWLYAFVLTASGVAHPVYSALVMTIFWIGTLPALVATACAIRAWGGALAAKLPWITAAALIAAGLFTLTQRSLKGPAHAAVERISRENDWLQQAQAAVRMPPACCKDEKSR